jgi:DNA-binding NtrC family response regulator
VIPIHLLPLRERPDDVLPLARHFLAKWSRELERSLEGWSPEVEECLLRAPWAGNARELENAIERGVVLARGARLELDDLMVDAVGVREGAEPAEGGLREFLDAAAADRIRKVLAEKGGRRMEAAQALGIDRTTLYRLMRKFGIGSVDPG